MRTRRTSLWRPPPVCISNKPLKVKPPISPMMCSGIQVLVTSTGQLQPAGPVLPVPPFSSTLVPVYTNPPLPPPSGFTGNTADNSASPSGYWSIGYADGSIEWTYDINGVFSSGEIDARSRSPECPITTWANLTVANPTVDIPQSIGGPNRIRLTISLMAIPY